MSAIGPSTYTVTSPAYYPPTPASPAASSPVPAAVAAPAAPTGPQPLNSTGPLGTQANYLT
jgi:hypothetical protein